MNLIISLVFLVSVTVAYLVGASTSKEVDRNRIAELEQENEALKKEAQLGKFWENPRDE